MTIKKLVMTNKSKNKGFLSNLFGLEPLFFHIKFHMQIGNSTMLLSKE
jgi:hypothetical protein